MAIALPTLGSKVKSHDFCCTQTDKITWTFHSIREHGRKKSSHNEDIRFGFRGKVGDPRGSREDCGVEEIYMVPRCLVPGCTWSQLREDRQTIIIPHRLILLQKRKVKVLRRVRKIRYSNSGPQTLLPCPTTTRRNHLHTVPKGPLWPGFLRT